MIERDQALELMRQALTESTAEQTEVVLIGEDFSLTRFAESQIHQNLYRSESTLYIRAVNGKRLGISSTGDLSSDSIARAVKEACAFTELLPPDEAFVSFPSPAPHQNVETFFRSTNDCSPRMRAESVKRIVDLAGKERLEAAGAFRTVTEAVAVLNSLGVECFNQSTRAELSATINGGEGNSGWGIEYSRDATEIDPDRLARRAVDKAVRSLDPIALESGAYTVILEPAAVGQLLLFLAFMGFGGKTLHERRSFMSGKIGEQITGSNITIVEDPFHPQIAGVPFDYEGVPRRRVPLIENGIAKGAVYNTYYANLAGVESTGHALPPDNSYGPYPKHLVMEGGESSLDEIVASTARGVYITHFWYVNFLNPMRTMVTGTTRDGTFLVEEGKITRAIRNMRMSQSILDAFAQASMISRERSLYPQYSVVMLVPAMKIDSFTLESTEG